MKIVLVALASAIIVAEQPPYMSVARAETQSPKIELRMDWKNYEKQASLADDLVKRGAMPLPLVFVNGQLRAMLDKQVVIDYRGKKDVSIDVGILQLIERPLYSLTLRAAPNGDVTSAKLNFVVLSIAQSNVAGRAGNTLKISEKLARDIPLKRDQNNTIHVDLPAAPYAEIAKFVFESKEPLVVGKGLRVQPENADSTMQPLAAYLSDKKMGPLTFNDRVSSKGIALYGLYDGSGQKTTSKLYSQVPATYKPDVNSYWLGATAWLQFSGIFGGDKTEPLLLKSVPGGAAIFLAGTNAGQETNSTISAYRGTWNTIS